MAIRGPTLWFSMPSSVRRDGLGKPDILPPRRISPEFRADARSDCGAVMWSGLTESDLRFWKDIAEFGRKAVLPHILEWDRDAVFPRPIWRKIGRQGLLALGLPRAHGGRGDLRRLALALDAFAYGSKDLGIVNSWGVHVAMASLTIAECGKPALKRRLLPKMASGTAIGAFALTEPEAGSNVGAMRTTAASDGAAFTISGRKSFVSNGPDADVVVVVARDPECGADAYSAFAVERSTPGFRTGAADAKTCIRTSSCGEIRLEGCRVPAENLLGTRGSAMQSVVMPALDRDRCVVWAGRLGRMRNILEDASAYATKRIQFGKPIARHQAILFKLSAIKIRLETAECLLTTTLDDLAAGKPVNDRAAIARYVLGKATMESADDAFQIFGGYGFDPTNHVERYHRDARLDGIGGGTDEIQQIIVGKQVIAGLDSAKPWLSPAVVPAVAAGGNA